MNYLKKVVIFQQLYERGQSIFAKQNEVDFLTCPQRCEQTFIRLVKEHQARVVVLDSKPFSQHFFTQLTPRSLIVRFGTGVDNIPIDYCKQLGHQVVAIPNASSDSVCEYVFSFLSIFCRKLFTLNNYMINKTWKKEVGRTLAKKKLAILGFGNIGKKVTMEAVEHYNMEVSVLLRHGSLQQKQLELEKSELFKTVVFTEDLQTAVHNADFVSIHLSLNSENKFIINQSTLRYFKPDAFLINTARGSHIVEADLCQALIKKEIAGAALDVFENEPYYPTSNSTHQTNQSTSTKFTYHALLKEHSNLFLTPHIAGNTEEANNYIAQMVLKNLVSFYKNNI